MAWRSRLAGIPWTMRGSRFTRSGARRVIVTLVVAMAGGSVASGCGEAQGDPLSLATQHELRTIVAQARAAVRDDDLAATHAALERLRTRVRALRDAGQIDGGDAEQLLKFSAIAELKAEHTLTPAEPSLGTTTLPAER